MRAIKTGAALITLGFLAAMSMVVLSALALAGSLPGVAAGTGAARTGAPSRPVAGGVPVRLLPSSVATVIAFARSQLGAPYRWGGAGPGSWDCSGLVMVAYGTVGRVLTHNAQAQYDATAATTVALDRLQPGDLVFFGPDLGAIGHVGIYVGDGDMIDAPHTGATVRVESIHWPDLLVASRPLATPA